MKHSRAPTRSEAPPQRLIDAAIQQIEQHGLGQLTVRGVAAAAEMNIAAVNYYFRSKEALVAAALEASLRNMVDDSKLLVAGMAQDPFGALSELLVYYLEGGLRFPRIGKAHLHDAFVRDDYDGAFPAAFAPVLCGLQDAVRAAVFGLGAPEAARRVVAAVSAVFFPTFFTGLYRPLGALDSPGERLAYAQEIARQTLAPVPLASRKRSRR